MTDISKLSKQFEKIDALHTRLDNECERMEKMILPYLDFLEDGDEGEIDFSIFHQSGDGFVLQLDMMNTPLSRCLSIIKSKGKLTYDDYLGIAI